MESLVRVGLTNAATAALLSIGVALIVRLWRNPHVAYALWLIVLVRLIAPPCVQIPWRALDWFAPQVAAERTESLIDAVPPTSPSTLEPTRALFAAEDTLQAGAPVRPHFTEIFGAIWLAGAVSYAILTLIRVRWFARAVRRCSSTAPDWLSREIAELAQTVRLRSLPRVQVVAATLPPMVWSGWRPLLLLPQAIVDGIDVSQRRLLLLHELQHLRRRDHQVRWFTVGLLALFWWHPCAWWAVRRLQDAEEECCDTAVVAVDPQQAPSYGEALLAVCEFVSCGALPAAAVSVGVERKNHLKRRMTMILNESRWPKLSKSSVAAIAVCGAAVLGISITHAAADPQATPTPTTKTQATARPTTPAPVSATAPLRTTTPASQPSASTPPTSPTATTRPATLPASSSIRWNVSADSTQPIAVGFHQLIPATRFPLLEANIRIAKAEIEIAEASVEQKMAELMQVDANRKFHASRFARMENLYKSHAISNEGMEEARHERENDAADLQRAHAAVRGAKAQVEVKKAMLFKAETEAAEAKRIPR